MCSCCAWSKEQRSASGQIKILTREFTKLSHLQHPRGFSGYVECFCSKTWIKYNSAEELRAGGAQRSSIQLKEARLKIIVCKLATNKQL